jgi:hypothetical protein
LIFQPVADEMFFELEFLLQLAKPTIANDIISNSVYLLK